MFGVYQLWVSTLVHSLTNKELYKNHQVINSSADQAIFTGGQLSSDFIAHI